LLRRHSYWLLPLAAAALVALSGARLITLSVRERSEQLRRAAESAVLRHGGRIEAELAQLADMARREHHGALNTLDTSSRAPVAGRPGRGWFSMSSGGSVLQVAPGDAAIAHAVAAEWTAARAAHRREAVLFGPVRHGSEWIVAARVPLTTEPGAEQAWS